MAHVVETPNKPGLAVLRDDASIVIVLVELVAGDGNAAETSDPFRTMRSQKFGDLFAVAVWINSNNVGVCQRFGFHPRFGTAGHSCAGRKKQTDPQAHQSVHRELMPAQLWARWRLERVISGTFGLVGHPNDLYVH